MTFRALIALLALIVAAVPAAAAPPTGRAALAGRIHAYLLDLAERHQFGGVVLVAAGDRILFEHGYGPADARSRHAVDAATRIPIASITKTLTSTAIMVLVDRGRLRIGQPLCDFIQSCPEQWRAVTLEHLLAQTSGIPTHIDRPGDYPPTNTTALLAMLSSRPLEFQPGTRFRYGNANHFLLGLVIERVTGRPYHEALADLVLRPLGMRATGPDLPGRTGRRAAALRWLSDGRIEPVPAIPYSWTNSASGLVSTAGDLFRYARALRTGRLLTPATRETMWTRRTDAYALGWWVPPGDDQIVRGTGGSHGYQGALDIDLRHDLVIVVLCNIAGPACSSASERLHDLTVEATIPRAAGIPGESHPQAGNRLVRTLFLSPAAPRTISVLAVSNRETRIFARRRRERRPPPSPVPTSGVDGVHQLHQLYR